MKKYILFTPVLMYFLNSCTTEKRRYMKGFYFGKHTVVQSKKKPEHEQRISLHIDQKTILKSEELLVLRPEYQKPTNRHSFHAIPFTLKNSGDACDTLILANGTKLLGKIIEINKTEIKTQGCDGGPPVIRTLLKTTVRQIKYSDGKEEEFIQQPALKEKIKEKKKINGFSLTGFIFSLLAYLSIIPTIILLLTLMIDMLVIIPGIIGLIAFTFALIGILQITNNKDKYRGLGFSIAALILSLPLVASMSFAFTFVPYASSMFAAIIVGLLIFSFLLITINYIIKNKKETNAK